MVQVSPAARQQQVQHHHDSVKISSSKVGLIVVLVTTAVFGCLQVQLYRHFLSRSGNGAQYGSSSPATTLLDSFAGSRRQTASRQEEHHKQNEETTLEERCAINLFGLPRAFRSLVLPSLIKNVIRPNAAYGCDYFVHYYHLEEEPAGRSGQGGRINPKEIYLLKQAVLDAAAAAISKQQRRQQTATTTTRTPAVEFVVDMEADFWKQYDSLLAKIRTVKDAHGQYLYYPWRARTYEYPTTTDNIVKMWHSIQRAWQCMKQHAALINNRRRKEEHPRGSPRTTRMEYTRVAMLRSDVVYATPIDIYKVRPSGGGKDFVDTTNAHAVIPAFGRHPVSDRIIYGPAGAVEIWAAQRFERLQTHVKTILRKDPGYGMHSERFLKWTIFPAIRDEARTTIVEDDTMCFFRARADESVWISDCEGPEEVSDPNIMKQLGHPKPAVERLLGRACGQVTKLTKSVRSLDCASNNQQQVDPAKDKNQQSIAKK